MEKSFKCFRCNFIQQYAASFSGTLAIVSLGMHFGWPSPSLPILLKHDSETPITNSEGGWITVAPIIGGPFGCILAALLVDRIGRKKSLLIAAPLLFLAWVIVAYARSALALQCGRFLAGIANGIEFSILPMYIGEIADKEIRGLLGSSLQVAYNLGILAINIIGIHFTIKMTALFSSLVPVLYFVTFWWVPESPYFLIMEEAKRKAGNSLKMLSSATKVDNENSTSKRPESILDIFTDRNNRKALAVITGLLVLQQFSGFMAIIFYCLTIFKEANIAIEDSTATIVYFSIQLLVSALSSILVDKTGRKPLLILSVAVSGFALAVEGFYFYAKTKTSIDTTKFGLVPLVALLLCTTSFNIGLTTIPILMLGELFPTSVKAYAICIANIAFSVFGTIVAKLFQIVKDEYGLHVPFLTFALSCFVGLLFIVFIVPETKGKTLEQIQMGMNADGYKEDFTLNSKPHEDNPLKCKL